MGKLIILILLFMGLLVSLAYLLFLALKSKFPARDIEVRRIWSSEFRKGNGLIFQICVRYAFDGRARVWCTTVSGYARNREKLQARREELLRFYEQESAKYRYIPVVPGLGTLDTPGIDNRLWFAALAFVIYAIIFVLISRAW